MARKSASNAVAPTFRLLIPPTTQRFSWTCRVARRRSSKDGLYTFNADTNTVRVLRGEADAYVGAADANAKPVKVKEDHQFSLVAGTKPVEVDPRQMTADLLPGGAAGRGFGEARAVGYGPYGDGFYEGYPYPAYPYMAYGWGYPWGFGYPYGFGVGFGYYGGFRGGFRGGFGRR